MFLSGFEPLAFRLGGGRSILLSYRNINFINDIPANLFIITDLTKVSQDLSCNFCENRNSISYEKVWEGNVWLILL